MLGSEIISQLAKISHLQPYFRGISTIDNVPLLHEDDFVIVNTEYYILFENGCWLVEVGCQDLEIKED